MIPLRHAKKMAPERLLCAVFICMTNELRVGTWRAAAVALCHFMDAAAVKTLCTAQVLAETVSEWQTSYIELTNSPTDNNEGDAAGQGDISSD
jgi:hypothetical protein